MNRVKLIMILSLLMYQQNIYAQTKVINDRNAFVLATVTKTESKIMLNQSITQATNTITYVYHGNKNLKNKFFRSLSLPTRIKGDVVSMGSLMENMVIEKGDQLLWLITAANGRIGDGTIEFLPGITWPVKKGTKGFHDAEAVVKMLEDMPEPGDGDNRLAYLMKYAKQKPPFGPLAIELIGDISSDKIKDSLKKLTEEKSTFSGFSLVSLDKALTKQSQKEWSNSKQRLEYLKSIVSKNIPLLEQPMIVDYLINEVKNSIDFIDFSNLAVEMLKNKNMTLDSRLGILYAISDDSIKGDGQTAIFNILLNALLESNEFRLKKSAAMALVGLKFITNAKYKSEITKAINTTKDEVLKTLLIKTLTGNYNEIIKVSP